MSRSGRIALQTVLAAAAGVVLGLGIAFGPRILQGQDTDARKLQEQNKADREKLSKMTGMDTMSPLLVQVAKVVKPAVVEVRVTKMVEVPQSDVDDLLRRFFGDEGPGDGRAQPQPRPPIRRELQGLGSGVIVDAEKGYVLTNNHVVAGADEVQIVTADNRKLKAEWIRTDPYSDVAVLKVKADGLIAVPLGDSSLMEVGSAVLAVGAPEGLPQTVTSGIISATGRSSLGFEESGQLYQDFLQTDAAINRGNSGGPLVNMKGEVIGINTAILSRTGVNEGIGFAIPSNMVKSVMSQLIEKGKVTRGYLGVSMQPVDEQLAKSFDLPSTHGALISQVVKDSPADKAGLKPGDFIVSADGRPIDSINTLRNMVANLKPGADVKFEFYREGKKESKDVKIAEQPKGFAQQFAPTPETPSSGVAKFGVKVSTLTPELASQLGYGASDKGVVITEVQEGSSAASLGLQPGMLITQVGSKAIATADDFAKAISTKGAEKGVRLTVRDAKGNQRFVFITPIKQPKSPGQPEAP